MAQPDHSELLTIPCSAVIDAKPEPWHVWQTNSMHGLPRTYAASARLQVRCIVLGAIYGAVFSIIIHKLNLTTGVIPGFGMSIALIDFFTVKLWNRMLAKMRFGVLPFTPQVTQLPRWAALCQDRGQTCRPEQQALLSIAARHANAWQCDVPEDFCIICTSRLSCTTRRIAPIQENAIMQTCVGSVAGLAFTGGFGSYLIAMDQQSYENVGSVPGNSAWVRLPSLHFPSGLLSCKDPC